MKKSLIAATILSFAVAAPFSSIAYAKDAKKMRPAEAISVAGISLSEAATKAEEAASGNAVEAEFSYSNKEKKWVYNIEVETTNGKFDVKVAADDGSIISNKKDD